MKTLMSLTLSLAISASALAQTTNQNLFPGWGRGGGATSGTNTGDVSFGAFGSTPNANAASISAQAITLQPANATNPGGVSISAQSFAGKKTLLDGVSAPSIDHTSSLTVSSGGSSTGTAIGLIFDNATALSTAGDIRMSFRSGGVEYANVTYDSTWSLNAVKYAQRSIFTCSSGSEGIVIKLSGTGGAATGIATKFCLCRSDGSNVYRWANLVTGTISSAANVCDP